MSDELPSLDEALARRSEALARATRRRGGRVSPSAVAELQALAALADMERKRRGVPMRARVPLAVAFVGTLLLASLLLFVRVPSTPIELEAVATDLRFELPAEQPLTRTMPLQSLRAVGVRREAEAGGVAGPPVVSLQAGGIDGCKGALTLEPVLLPVGAQVGLRAGAVPGRVHLSLKAPGARLQVSASGCDARRPAGAARGITLVLGGEEADIELSAADGAAIAFATGIAARQLAFDQTELLAGGSLTDSTYVRSVSTLRSGRLHLLALAGREQALRRGEALAFSRVEGELQELALADGALSVRFAGQARGMQTGGAGYARSLMPTWLEWLRANQAVSLLWGSALYAFGLAAAVRRWWRGPT